MKTTKIILLILLIAVFFSCKDQKNEAPEETKSTTFDVTLNMVVKQDDNFQLFFTDETMPNFDEKKSIWIPVKGSDKSQDIVFQFPEGEIPTNLRVDLGNNSKQQPMKLNSFKLNYFDKSYELKDSLITKNFVIGDQLIYDRKTSTLSPNQGKSPVYDPFLYPQSNLIEEISKLVK
jgi:hypothetical protein